MKQTYTFTFLFICASLAAQIPAGAVGYWPFDNNALDLSGNGNNGTATNTIPFPDRFNVPNKAYKFNGTTSKVVVPNSITVDIGSNQDFTFTIWEKAYSISNDGTILAKHITGSWDGYWFGVSVSDPGYCNITQHIDFYTASGYQQDACSDTDIARDTTWHFLTGVYKASTQSSYLYIDGVLQADTGKSSGTLSNTANLSFGFLDYTNGAFFHGVLDDGRLYKRMLTPAEILALYNETHIYVGINELNPPSTLSIFPNPGNGLFTINVSNGTAKMQLEVYNGVGQLILQQPLRAETTGIDLQGHAPGIYFVALSSPQGRKTVKLIKE